MPGYCEARAMAALTDLIGTLAAQLPQTTTIKLDRKARAVLDPIAVGIYHLDGMDTAVTCADGTRHIVNTDTVAEALKGTLESVFCHVMGYGGRLLAYDSHAGVATVEPWPWVEFEPWA